MQFCHEPFTSDLWAEAAPLLRAHWREIAHFQDIPLNVDVDAYLANENAGVLRFFTVRQNAALIGYAVFFVRGNLHYKDSVQAVQDVLYVRPEYRGVGKRFIAWCDAELSREGVQVTYQHVKAAHNFGPMLERMGYELVDLIYAKRLDAPTDVPVESDAVSMATA